MKPGNLKTLWDITSGQRLRYGAAVLAMGVSNVFTFAAPLVVRTAIDRFLQKEPIVEPGWLDRLALQLEESFTLVQNLTLAATLIVALNAVAGVFVYLRGRWAALASEAVVRRLRNRLHRHLEHLPCAFHDRTETGDLVQRCTSDVETIRVFLAAQVVEVGRAVLLLLMVLPVLLWLDLAMTIVSVALYPLIVAFAIIYFRRIRVLFQEVDEAEGALTSVLQENLTGIRVVRAFARQDFERDKFASKNAAFRDRTRELIGSLARYWGLSDLVCFCQLMLVLLCGAAWVVAGSLTTGEFFAFLTYQGLVIWPVRHLGRVLSDAGKATVSLGRIGEILVEPVETNPQGAGTNLPSLSGDTSTLRVDNLSFSFREGLPGLDGISFELRSGETLAFVGPPGSGKSTIVHLLLRLYDYNEGSIHLGDVELKDLRRQDVRSHIGVVLQEPFLYSKTLRENVRLGASASSERQIEDAVRAASLHDAVEGFRDGYETMVGERGVTLSGGQRQRVALARALLRDPPILILDDALSAVDTDTEAEILGALRRRHRERSTIVIAHRLSSIRHADRVLFLNDGRAVEYGPHERLMKQNGPYRSLWKLQEAIEADLESDLLQNGEAAP